MFGSWWQYVAVVAALFFGAGGAYLWWRRRTHLEPVHYRAGRVDEFRGDPDELERLAVLAAKSGDYETSVRWWFQAGVQRLTNQGFVANGTSRTRGQLVATVPSATMADLANQHERIVYGLQIATLADAEGARNRWPDVFREIRAAKHGVSAQDPVSR